jgi:ribosomal protein L5
MVEQRGRSHGSGEQFRQEFGYDRRGNRSIGIANTSDLPGVADDGYAFARGQSTVIAEAEVAPEAAPRFVAKFPHRR